MPPLKRSMLLAIPLAVGCGASTEPSIRVVHTEVSIDRPVLAVGDTLTIHVAVINGQSTAAYVVTQCTNAVAEVHSTADGATAYLAGCQPSNGSITIAAGDSIVATFRYRAASVGSYAAVGGLQGNNMISSQSPPVYFQVQ